MWSKQKFHACFFIGDKDGGYWVEYIGVEYNQIGKYLDVEA
jgi:hypothetical protein